QNALLDFLSGSGVPQLAQVAAGLRGALTTTAATYPRTIQLFNNSSGQFPFDESQTQYALRVDHTFSERSSGYLRFSATDGDFENQAAGALTAVSRGRELTLFNGGVVASHNYQLSSTAFNELKLQYSYSRAGTTRWPT
ncbi:MAG TPA: hypothetical protein VFY40_24335, partial [Blastocatellia bacterium]|nr:hypothetical protein [Blastocatellia bacterium]